ncbi:MAG: alpha/beta hydrolase [Ruminococcus sp.]|nr:alpha/beta hydrolase [Ruminococcus sp.]
MRKTKQFAVLLSALMLASAVTACNERTSAENTQETAEAVTEEITETEAPAQTETQSVDALCIVQQGMFSSGGIVTSAVGGDYDPQQSWKDKTRAGNTAHVDHANVFYQIPAEDNGNPIVYLHGYRQSRMCWMTTPDGREGFSELFLKKGYSAFLVDQPRRGEAGATTEISEDTDLDMWYGDLRKYDDESEEYYYEDDLEYPETATKYQPGDQAWYTYYRIGETDGKTNPKSQFPDDNDSLNQFLRQATPNTGNYDKVVISKALGEVMSDVQNMTGNKAIFMAHGEGCSVAWDLSVENLSAVVAIEPISVPNTSSVQYQKLIEANIPIVIYFGDYIEDGDSELASTEYWQEVHEKVTAFAEQYREDGGDCTVVDLPEEGIMGNSHFLFQEKNNQEIADLIQKWLGEHGLN